MRLAPVLMVLALTIVPAGCGSTGSGSNEDDLPYQPPLLRINEIMPSNSSVPDPDGQNEFDDWIELYNPGDQDVPLQGLHISDDPSQPTKATFAPGMVVPAHGFLLLWADDQAIQGATHLPFKLSASGEYVGLYANSEHANALIDSVLFPPLPPDMSVGRNPDGNVEGDQWTVQSVATPGQTNGP